MSRGFAGIKPRQRDRDRSRQIKRYGVAHHIRRRTLAPLVAAGLADCVRCGRPIEPDEPWDLGHSDSNPLEYSGPEHARCNRGAPHRNKTSRVW